MKFSNTVRILIAGVAACAAASASVVFDFDNDNLGTTTGFTDTVNGLSATFSSSADPGGFVIYSTIFQTLTGNVLGDPGPAGVGNLSLLIMLNQDVNAVTLDFATSDFGVASPLTVTAYENSALVGSASATGTVPAGFVFPEGEISYGNSTFNQIMISSAATDFAVDNIAFTTSPTNTGTVPEPSIASLFALGLALCIPAARSKLRRRQ